MSIIVREGPPEALMVVRRRAARGAGPTDPAVEVTRPHRKYLVASKAIVQGQLLQTAALDSWLYFLVRGESLRGAVSVAEQQGDPRFVFAAEYDAHAAAALAKAMAIAERLPQVELRNYELRILRIPALYFLAAWLHAETDDIIVPCRTPYGVERWTPVDEPRLLELLRPIATRRVQVASNAVV